VIRSLACLAVIASGGVASAAPLTLPLTMKLSEASNLHLADNHGAIHRTTEVTIAVHAHVDKTLQVESTGTRGQHDLYATPPAAAYNVDETTTWTTQWTGRWAVAGDKLVLDLVLAADQCTHTRVSTREAARTLPCRAASKRTRLTCASEPVTLEDPAQPNRSKPVTGWRCTPDAAEALGESPPRWLLGKASCIHTIASRMGSDMFRACKAP
jgi:hypothetical protein